MKIFKVCLQKVTVESFVHFMNVDNSVNSSITLKHKTDEEQ